MHTRLFINQDKIFEYLIIYLFIFIFSIRLFYVINIPCEINQHDFDMVGQTYCSHEGVIRYYAENNTIFNNKYEPKSSWLFFHQPLWHIIAGNCIKIYNFFGIKGYNAVEALQFLSLLISMIAMFYMYKILDILNFSKYTILICLTLYSFIPLQNVMSGYLNNDMLLMTFLLMTVFYAVKWYKFPTKVNIIKICLCFSCAAMTKDSGVLIAPAIMFLFVYQYLKNKELRKVYFIQFLVFTIIAIPLANIFRIYNYFYWNIGFFEFPKLNHEGFFGYIYDNSIFHRLFYFNPKNLLSPDIQFNGLNNDSNIILYLIKSLCWDENVLIPQSNYIISGLFYFFNITYFVCMILAFFKCITLWKNLDKILFLFFVIFSMSFFIAYLYFAILQRIVPAAHARYIIAAIFPFIIAIGVYIENLKYQKFKKLVINILTIIYVILALAVFLAFVKIY